MAQMIALWTFACKLYSQPDVKNACLRLQMEYAADVPLLLMACWLGRYYSVCPQEQIRQLNEHAAQWSDSCIRPLRGIRQQMKQASLSDAPAWQQVREQIKSTELSAEKQLLVSLESNIQQYHMVGLLSLVPQNEEVEVLIDRLCDVLYQCFPTDQPEAGIVSSQVLMAHLISATVNADWPQIQYDAVLARIASLSHSVRHLP